MGWPALSGNEAAAALFLRLKLFLELLTIGDVQQLRILELVEQCAGQRGVLPIALKIGDHRPLTCDAPHAVSDVVLHLL
jgi:hypothetical protein